MSNRRGPLERQFFSRLLCRILLVLGGRFQHNVGHPVSNRRGPLERPFFYRLLCRTPLVLGGRFQHNVGSSDVRRYAEIALQEREGYDREVEKRTDAQGGPVYSTPDVRLVRVAEEIIDHLVEQQRLGIKVQQEELVSI